jgi:uncharacterized protein
MASADEIEVQVVYATPRRQFMKTLRMPVGSHVVQAIRASDLLSEFAELELPAQPDVHLANSTAAKTHATAPSAAAVLVWRDTGVPVSVGVFGELVQLDTCLQDGERVEVYRPLLADPKEARRRRARAKQKR